MLKTFLKAGVFLVLWLVLLSLLPGGPEASHVLGTESVRRLGEEGILFQGVQKLLLTPLSAAGFSRPWAWMLGLALGSALAGWAASGFAKGWKGLAAGVFLFSIALAGSLAGASPWALFFAGAAGLALREEKSIAGGFALGLAFCEDPAAFLLLPWIVFGPRRTQALAGLFLGLSVVLGIVLGSAHWDIPAGKDPLLFSVARRAIQEQFQNIFRADSLAWGGPAAIRVLPLLFIAVLASLRFARTWLFRNLEGRKFALGISVLAALVIVIPAWRATPRSPWELSFGFACLRLAGTSPLVLGPGPLAQPVLGAAFLSEDPSFRGRAQVPDPRWLEHPRTAVEWLRKERVSFFRGDVPDGLLSSNVVEGVPVGGRWFRGLGLEVTMNPIPSFPKRNENAPGFAAYLVLEADSSLEESGGLARAGQMLDKAQGWAGRDARCWSLLSWGWRKAGEPRRGAAAAVRARTLNREKLEFLLGAAEALDQAGDDDIADAYLMEALGRAPGNPVVLEARAAFFYRNNNPQRAQPFLEAARAARFRERR